MHTYRWIFLFWVIFSNEKIAHFRKMTDNNGRGGPIVLRWVVCAGHSVKRKVIILWQLGVSLRVGQGKWKTIILYSEFTLNGLSDLEVLLYLCGSQQLLGSQIIGRSDNRRAMRLVPSAHYAVLVLSKVPLFLLFTPNHP